MAARDIPFLAVYRDPREMRGQFRAFVETTVAAKKREKRLREEAAERELRDANRAEKRTRFDVQRA